MAGETLRVALAGSPNTGKSTLFNLLTGLSQHVGNWPGKTVERKTGTCQRGDTVFFFVDLPGSYSLTANSLEEEIARDYIIQDQPDVVAVVVDASSLERNLYLVCELLELGVPLVVVLNMMDIARAQGLQIDPQALESALGVPVVPTVAARGAGISELLDAVQAVAFGEVRALPPPPPTSPTVQTLVQGLDSMLPPDLAIAYPRRWALVKLLEGDRGIAASMRTALSANGWRSVDSFLRLHEDAILEIAGARYEWIAQISERVVHRLEGRRIPLGERADRILTHPLGGVLAFLGVVAAVFWTMFTLGAPLQERLDEWLVQDNADRLESALQDAPDRLVSLLTDGIIGGAGLVLTFVPILAILFLALALLEDLGYMARAAFVMDRFMHLIGLRGKSFLPLFLGFGCNVPAILGSRIVESQSARLTTILVAPLMPCAARMVVVALFTAAFFGGAAALISWTMITINLAVLALMALILSRFVLPREESAFVMELPSYHAPNWRTVFMATWQRVRAFLILASTAILAVSLVVWALSSFPSDRIEDSILGMIGRGLEPIGQLAGLDWQIIVALMTSFVAKENTIATLGVILGTGEVDVDLSSQLTQIMVPAAAVAFIAIQMLFIPCVASVAAIRRETRSWRWTAFAIGYMLAISFAAGIIIYQVARLMGWGM
ncbi:MAG: ferrous iron transport protein B [Dehalococcoidia bacterium]